MRIECTRFGCIVDRGTVIQPAGRPGCSRAHLPRAAESRRASSARSSRSPRRSARRLGAAAEVVDWLLGNDAQSASELTG